MIVADGKLLFQLGCPQNKIKFFVGKEFDSEQSLIIAFSTKSEKEQKQDWHPDCAFEFLKSIPHLPMAFNGELPVKASNAEIKRWLETKSVEINGQFPKPNDIVTYPITSLVFFPSSKKRKTTFY